MRRCWFFGDNVALGVGDNGALSVIHSRAMIFEQSFSNNFYDNLIFLFFYWSKTMEREKRTESKNIM